MASNTTFKPIRSADLTADALNFAGHGTYGECVAENTEVHIDLQLADDVLLTGGVLLVKGGKFEDKISMQVVHPTMGVLNEFVTDYRVVEDSQKQFDLSSAYPAKIYAGLILRIKYVSCAIPGVRDIAANYYLHKVLV